MGAVEREIGSRWARVVRRCVQIGSIRVLTFECRSWHMRHLVKNILYLMFLVCSAPSRTKLPEQMRTDDSRSTPIKLTTWHSSVVARLASSFVDCDNGIILLTVYLGTSSFQVVLATCTGPPSI